MQHTDALRQRLPEAAKDLKLNIQSVLRPEALSEPEAWSIAYASALFLDAPGEVVDAFSADGIGAGVTEAYLDDAHAAVALMRMNTVYYRFRHMVGKGAYAMKPAKLRMQRMAKPATEKRVFELISMACAALAGCELCIQNHEHALIEAGASEDQVHDAVRIAAVVSGFVAALALPELTPA